MRRISIVAGMLALSAPLVAWPQSAVIASVGQATVTQADLTHLLESLDPAVRANLESNPAGLDQLVRGRLAQTVVVSEAKSKGFDQQPQVKLAMEQAQRNVLLNRYLASIAAPPADYPSDAEIQATYNQNQAAFTMPRAFHFAQIYVALPSDPDAGAIERARKQADDLAHKARAKGADFAALASASSDDKPSAAHGGDMGYVPEAALLPEIRKAADGMKAGDVSAPIQTAMGFHVVKLLDTRAAGVSPLADVKEQIRVTMRQQREQQNAQSYLAKALGSGTVAINEDVLKKALGAAR